MEDERQAVVYREYVGAVVLYAIHYNEHGKVSSSNNFCIENNLGGSLGD